MGNIGKNDIYGVKIHKYGRLEKINANLIVVNFMQNVDIIIIMANCYKKK